MMPARVPIIRTSERAAFGRCPWAWWQRWRRGLVPIGSTADALWFGSLVHIALAKWYCGPGLVRGPHPAETFAELAKDELRTIKTERRIADHIIEEKFVPAQELGAVMLNGYVETYGEDESWHIISAEQSGQLDVLDEENQLLAIYAWTFDLVYRDLRDDRIKLGEHKTAKTVSVDHLPLDKQAGSYWAVAGPYLRERGILGPRENIAAITYNFLRKGVPDPRPRNPEGYYTNKPTKDDFIAALTTDGYDGPLAKAKLPELVELAERRCLEVYGEVSKQQPKPLFHREEIRRTAGQRARQIQHIRDEAQVMNALRLRELPVTKTTTRECRFCDYYHYCLLDDQGFPDAEEYRRSMYRVEDPYADHRKSTEE